MHRKRLASLAASALIACALTLPHGASVAAPSYSGTIAGTFSDPVLAGPLIFPDGSTVALDNTASAVFSGVGTNQIAWGVCDSTCGAVSWQSVVTFSGESFVDVAPDVVFKLGTLSYLNGSSFSNTLIFGATLTVGVSGSLVIIDPAAAQMSVLTTGNGGVDVLADADFLAFDVLPPTLHVYEGATAVADVYGYIHGDPQLVFGNLALPPDQAANGFLVSEPGNFALLGLGLALLGLTRRRIRA